VVSAGGSEIISSGGTAIGASVTSGGTLTVIKGGVASGTIVSTGGTELVSSGASIVGATLSGGVVEIKSGGTAGSSTITISSGTLLLDDSQHFSGTVAGLADANQVVDLADINFAALHPLQYSSSTGSGTLTVTDGVHTAQLALLGNYTVGNFKTATDGHGGTLITDPAVDSSGYLTPHS
jgi:autotransporter passenger strand-loop-strand repeat protein